MKVVNAVLVQSETLKLGVHHGEDSMQRLHQVGGVRNRVVIEVDKCNKLT